MTATPTIQIPTEAMRDIVARAVLEQLGTEQRDLLIQAALEYLITAPPKSGYGSHQEPSPLQHAFNNAVREWSPCPPPLPQQRQVSDVARRSWRYRTWGGSKCTVVADRVEFHTSHVVWLDHLGYVVLAETVANVNELSEVGNAGSATRGVRPVSEAQR